MKNELQNLEIKIIGEKKLAEDYSGKIEEIKEYYLNLEIPKIENQETYKTGFQEHRNFEKIQKKIDETIVKLKDKEILKLENSLIEIKKIIASQKTQIKKRLKEYKSNFKEMLLNNTICNITEQDNFKLNIYKLREDLEKELKGRSDFEQMNEIAEKFAELETLRLIKKQNEFNKNKKIVKEFMRISNIALTDEILDPLLIEIDAFNTLDDIQKKILKIKDLEVEQKDEKECENCKIEYVQINKKILEEIIVFLEWNCEENEKAMKIVKTLEYFIK